MNKILISIVLTCVSLYGVQWLSYDEARLIQEKNAKIIMIDVVRTSCHYCSEMETEVFDNENMTKYLNERFILVKVNLEKEPMPLMLKPLVTPSFYFIDKEEEVVEKINGAWNIPDFKSLIKDIK